MDSLQPRRLKIFLFKLSSYKKATSLADSAVHEANTLKWADFSGVFILLNYFFFWQIWTKISELSPSYIFKRGMLLQFECFCLVWLRTPYQPKQRRFLLCWLYGWLGPPAATRGPQAACSASVALERITVVRGDKSSHSNVPTPSHTLPKTQYTHTHSHTPKKHTHTAID